MQCYNLGKGGFMWWIIGVILLIWAVQLPWIIYSLLSDILDFSPTQEITEEDMKQYRKKAYGKWYE